MTSHASPLTARRALAAIALTAILGACGGSSDNTGPNTGSVAITVTSTGADVDPTAYTYAIDGGAAQAVPSSGTTTVTGVRTGTHSVALTSLASNCTVANSPLSVTVSSGGTAAAQFSVACVARRLAFETDRDGNFEVYAINDDGTGLTRLTNDPSFDGLPAWSPDGSKIIFSSDRSRTSAGLDLWTMNADGSGLTRLTQSIGENGRAKYSPDGTKIVFTSTRTDTTAGHAEIWVMNADGSAQTQLTHDDAFANVPSWSPDGSKIVFHSNRDGHQQLYVMNADGSSLTRLTNDASNDAEPAWSPDGTRIAFQSDRDRQAGDTTTVQVYVMNADGSGVQRLVTDPGHFDGSPAWSRDGRRILFDSDRTGNFEVFVMAADGSGATNVTNNAGDDGFGNFRP